MVKQIQIRETPEATPGAMVDVIKTIHVGVGDKWFLCAVHRGSSDDTNPYVVTQWESGVRVCSHGAIGDIAQYAQSVIDLNIEKQGLEKVLSIFEMVAFDYFLNPLPDDEDEL